MDGSLQTDTTGRLSRTYEELHVLRTVDCVLVRNDLPTVGVEMKFAIDPISRDEQLLGRGNFEENGKLYLLRCYNCDHINGKENYMSMVASGRCAWCGWSEEKPL